MPLPTNIRLGWKNLPGTNALAYYEKAYITAIKGIITLAPGRLRNVRLGWKCFTETHNKVLGQKVFIANALNL